MVGTVMLKGIAASGSVVETVIDSSSFGMIRASYKPFEADKSTSCAFWKYATFLVLPQLPNIIVTAAKARGKKNLFNDFMSIHSIWLQNYTIFF
jgi:hypothetical protein